MFLRSHESSSQRSLLFVRALPRGHSHVATTVDESSGLEKILVLLLESIGIITETNDRRIALARVGLRLGNALRRETTSFVDRSEDLDDRVVVSVGGSRWMVSDDRGAFVKGDLLTEPRSRRAR